MIPYVFLFSLLLLLSYLEKTNIKLSICGVAFNGKTLYCVLIFIVLTLFMGLRAETVGTDIVQYAYRYEFVKTIIGDDGLSASEFGYNYLQYFFHYILGVPFQFFLFTLSAITSFSVAFVLYRYSNDIFVSLTLFLTLGGFAMALSGIRQYLAVSLTVISFYFCEKRKIVPFLCLCFLAYSIHNSSIIFLFVYFLWGARLSIKTSVTFTIIMLAFSFLGTSILINLITFLMPMKYSRMDLNEGYNINYLVLAVPFVITFFCSFFLNYEHEGKLSEKNTFFFILSCLYLAMLILSLNNNQLGRLSYYFGMGNVVVVASVLDYQLKKNYKSAMVAKTVILLLCYAYFFISTPGGTFKIDNYRMFFF